MGFSLGMEVVETEVLMGHQDAFRRDFWDLDENALKIQPGVKFD